MKFLASLQGINSSRYEIFLFIGEFLEKISVSTSLPLPFTNLIVEVENDVIRCWVICLALRVSFAHVQFSNRLAVPAISHLRYDIDSVKVAIDMG